MIAYKTMFSTKSKKEIMISATINLLSANAFNLDQAKILSFGKELRMQFELSLLTLMAVKYLWVKQRSQSCVDL